MQQLPRWMRVIAALLAALLLASLLIVASAWWYSGSESALARVLATAMQQSGGKLEIEGSTGSLRDRLRIARLRWHDGDLTVVAEQIELQWSPWALLGRQVQITELTVQQVRVMTQPSKEPMHLPASLALPLALHAEHIQVARLDVSSKPDQVLQFSDLQLRYDGNAQRHQLQAASVTTPYGSVQGDLELQAQAPYALSGSMEYHRAADTNAPSLDAILKLDGQLENINARLDAQAGTAKVNGAASIKPFEPAWLSTLQLNSKEVDLANLNAGWPQTKLDLAVQATTAADAQLNGSIQVHNALPGTLSEQRIPLTSLQASLQFNGQQFRVNDLQLLLGQGIVNGSGVLDAATLQSQWQLALRDIDLRSLHRPLRSTRLAGTIKASIGGRLNELQADLREPGNLSVSLALTQHGDDIELRQLEARAATGHTSGHVMAQGHLSLADHQAFSVKLNSTALDPAAFGAFPSAAINAEANVTGTLAPNWQAHLNFKLADSSRMRGLPLAGAGRLQVNARQVRDADLQLRLGDNHLEAHGNWGKHGDTLDFKLDAPRLTQIDSSLAGSLNSSGTLVGSFAAPVIQAQLSGAKLRYGGDHEDNYSAATLNGNLIIGSAAQQPLHVLLQATGLSTPRASLAQTMLKLDGTLAQHDIAFNGSNPAHPRLDFKTRLNGGWEEGWRGQVLSLEQQGDLNVRLRIPVALEVAAMRLHVGAAELDIAQDKTTGHVHLRDLLWQAGKLNTSGSFNALPLAPLLTLTGIDSDLQSSLLLGGQWALNTTPRLNGTLTLNRETGDLALTSASNSSTATPFGLSDLSLQARWNDDALSASLSATASRIGKLNAQLQTTPSASSNSFALDVPAKMTAQLDVISLRPLALLSGTSAVVDGKLRLNLSGSGPLNALKLSGTAEGDGLTLEAPQYGVLYKNGRLRAQLLDDQLQIQELAISAGDGKLSASGTMNLRSLLNESVGASTLQWQAERFRALQRPDARLIVDGNGTLRWIADGKQSHIELNGKVRAAEAHFELPDSSSVRLGDDVIVKGKTRNSVVKTASTPTNTSARSVPLQLELDADLGPRFSIAGRGLDARLEGQIKVRSTANGNLLAYGRIATANGSYQAFGQKLNIERGLLYFDGPIDNPALDLLALRKNLPVEAGVQITGTAKVPQAQLVSDPSVSDGEKLSWLILGKGLDSASSADTGTLQAAAGLLYGAVGSSASGTSLAKSLGLDDVGLQQRASGGEGQVVSFGKRISERLYLAYEQGLSVAGNALRIEYVLTRYITLRAEAGQVNSFGVYFNRSYP